METKAFLTENKQEVVNFFNNSINNYYNVSIKDFMTVKFDNGSEKTETISADSANSARWIGKKIHGVFEAIVLNRIR